MQGAFKTPGEKKGSLRRVGDLSGTNWTELRQSRTRRKLGSPAAPEAHISPQRTQGSSLAVLVTVLKEGFLNLAKYRATSVTTFAFWGSEDESHIPGFQAFLKLQLGRTEGGRALSRVYWLSFQQKIPLGRDGYFEGGGDSPIPLLSTKLS